MLCISIASCSDKTPDKSQPACCSAWSKELTGITVDVGLHVLWGIKQHCHQVLQNAMCRLYSVAMQLLALRVLLLFVAVSRLYGGA